MSIWTENLLPADITLDIFSRLPAESVVHCRQVCKTWRTLLHQPVFAHMHLQRSLQLDNQSNGATSKLSLLLFIPLKGGNDPNFYQICYYEYDENDDGSCKMQLKMLKYPPVQPSYFRCLKVDSINGLVCFKTDDTYICNPITREYVILPRSNNCSNIGEGYQYYQILHGFGYLPSTNEYKVVRISLHSHDSGSSGWYNDNAVDAQVYTLGSGSGWRKIKSSSLPKSWIQSSWGVLANGSLYWLGNEGKSISFDLADEELSYIQSLTYVMDDERCYFQAWRGRLCFVHRIGGEGIDIWSFNKNKESSTTTTTRNDMNGQDYQSWSWTKDFNMALKAYAYEPFALTKSGEVLMLPSEAYYPKIVSCYDPKTSNIRKLGTDYVFSGAIPHVNSFVSLRALGEDAKMAEPVEILPDIKRFKPNRY